MTKRKTRTNSRTSRRNPKGKRKTTKPRKNSSLKSKVLGIVIMAALLTLVGNLYRPFILKSVFNYQCVSLEPGDYGTRLIFDAINLNHQIKENPFKKEELLNMLSEELVWFKKNKIQKKDKIKFYSKYDEFCFFNSPVYDFKDDIDRKYQLRFIGCHKYRVFGKKMVKIENYFASISNGRIDEIYPIPIGELDKESHSLTNTIFNYYYPVIFIFWLILFGAVTYVTNLPDYVFKFATESLRKMGNIFK